MREPAGLAARQCVAQARPPLAPAPMGSETSLWRSAVLHSCTHVVHATSSTGSGKCGEAALPGWLAAAPPWALAAAAVAGGARMKRTPRTSPTLSGRDSVAVRCRAWV